MKIAFETSKGTCVGVVDGGIVRLNVESEQIINLLYPHIMEIAAEDDGWVRIHFDDSYYGPAEYPYRIITV